LQSHRQEPRVLTSQLLLAPNQLTLLRLVFIPFIVISVLYGHWRWALGLFVAAGLSDALDGFLARLLQQKTTLGQYLDPIADKLLLSTMFVILAFRDKIAWKYTVLVFSRDVCIILTCAVLFAATALRDFRPSIFGKSNTVAEVGAVFFVLLYEVTGTDWIRFTRRGFLYATMILTVLSGVHYVFLAGHRLALLHAKSSAARQ
jgi:cardiolipin synthase (CMP-forming)